MNALIPPEAGSYGPPAVYVTYDGDTHWLECDHGTGEGSIIAPVEPGDKWDDLVAKVREHQAEHGCATQPPHPAPGQADPIEPWEAAYEAYSGRHRRLPGHPGSAGES